METRKLLMKPEFFAPVTINTTVFGYVSEGDQVRIGQDWNSVDALMIGQQIDEYRQSEDFGVAVGQHILLRTINGNTISEGRVTSIILVGKQVDHDLAPLAHYAAPLRAFGELTSDKWWQVSFDPFRFLQLPCERRIRIKRQRLNV